MKLRRVQPNIPKSIKENSIQISLLDGLTANA